jgi:fumarate hydratase subunit beta
VSELIKIETPLDGDLVRSLKAGDMVELSGIIYSARDSAHKRMIEALDKGEDLPFDIQGAVIYYMGPTPPPPGKVIGSAGPTTAGRMDSYAPRLIAEGLRGMIGKGNRSQEVIEACKERGAVYFGAIGGAGALISGSIKSARVIAYEELGPEALRELEVEAMPAVVVNDSRGRDLYDEGRKKYEIK